MRFRRHVLYGLAVALAAGGIASAHGTGRPLHAALSGAAEIPAGDPDGTGSAVVTVNPGKMKVCWELTVSGIAPATMAHIHRAPSGQNGPVVVPLTPPADGSSSGCANVGEEAALGLFESPDDYYVNVHNAEHPAGALRGQLASKKLK